MKKLWIEQLISVESALCDCLVSMCDRTRPAGDFRMWSRSLRLVAAISIVLLSSSSGRSEPPGKAFFAQAAVRLLKQADIATDADFDDWKRDARKVDQLHAPASFRRMVTVLGIKANYNLGVECEIRSRDVTLTWLGGFVIRGEVAQAKTQFFDAIARCEMVDAKGRLESPLKRRFDEFVESFGERAASDNLMTFERTHDSVREELLVENLTPNVGSSEPLCLAQFKWAVTTPFEGAVPTVSELLWAFPMLTPLKEEENLMKVIANQPVDLYWFDTVRHRPKGTNGGWGAAVPVDVRAKFEEALRASGFREFGTSEWARRKGRPKRIATDWHRAVDSTYAAVVTMEGTNRILVQCQMPQKEPGLQK